MPNQPLQATAKSGPRLSGKPLGHWCVGSTTRMSGDKEVRMKMAGVLHTLKHRTGVTCLLTASVLLALSGIGQAAVSKKFRIGAHKIRAADKHGHPNINATLRNEADFVVIGHLSPHDRFYILSQHSFNVGTAFNCRKGDSKKCTAACQQCIKANPTDPDACRKTCRIQFVYGFALGRASKDAKPGTGFAGCAWIATSHLVRMNHSPKTAAKVLSLIPKRFRSIAKKCKGQRRYRYAKIAARGTSRCQHCRDKTLTGYQAGNVGRVVEK